MPGEQICPVCGQPLPPLAGSRIFIYNEAEAVLTLLTTRLGDPASWVPLRAALEAGATSAPGAYRLRYGGRDVYVGKTGNLVGRLARHARELQGRIGLDLNLCECTFVILPPPWDARTSEEIIIRHYRDQAKAPWNYQGFGANDPGRNRDDSMPSPWHREHPAISSFPVEVTAGRHTVASLLARIKEQLPYLFRYQASERGGEQGWREDLAGHMELDADYRGPADEFLANLCRSHLPQWQLTLLPRGFILYRESRTYPHGRVIYKRASE